MAFQSITQATAETIILATAELPRTALTLARVVLAQTTDKHLPDNIKAGLEKLFTANPLDMSDPAYRALADLMHNALREDFTPEGRAEAARLRAVLIDEGAWHDALAAMSWLHTVQSLAAADGVAVPLH